MNVCASSVRPSTPLGALSSPLDIVKLRPLMEQTRGLPSIRIALIDGPVAVDHAALAASKVRGIGDAAAACLGRPGDACTHGTLVAGVLIASRESGAPAICPDCTLIVRPIFSEKATGADRMPVATLDQLAEAIVDSVNASAQVLNVSAAVGGPSGRAERRIIEALDHAAHRGSLVVVAAGNRATGSSAITRHPWVLPVVACDSAGRPAPDSNLSHSVGMRGLRAPGEKIRSVDAGGTLRDFSGTSAAAPFVTGTVALLRARFPDATANDLRVAVTQIATSRRTTVVPPLLDASAAFRSLALRYGAAMS